MALTVQQQLDELNKQAEANQALIDKQPQGSAEFEKLVAKQRALNEQRNAMRGAARAETNIQSGKQLGQQLLPSLSLGRLDTSLGRATAGQVTAGQVDTSLGRVDANAIRQGRSGEVQDVLALRRQALQGMSGEEQRIRRDQALAEIGRAEQLQQRQLAAAQSGAGVRGGTAAAQQLLALQGANQQRIQFERDLYLANEQAKTQALSAYENSISAAEQSEFQRQAARAELQKFNLGQQLQERGLQQFNIGQQQQAQQFNVGLQSQTQALNLQQQLAEKQLQQFNLQQQAKEQFGQLSVGFGTAQLAEADIGGQRAAEAQRAAAAAASGGSK